MQLRPHFYTYEALTTTLSFSQLILGIYSAEDKRIKDILRIKKLEALNRSAIIRANHFSVNTPDGHKLDTFEIYYNATDMPHDMLYVVNFFGAYSPYENNFTEMLYDALGLQCHVIGFNYRGIIKSTGTARCSQDLVNDGIAQVQRLLDNGIAPENIILKGDSIGSLAAIVAAHFKKQGIEVIVFLIRSFSTFTNVVSGHISEKTPSWLTSSAISISNAFILSNRWEIDVKSAFNELRPVNKEYCVIKSNKADRIAHPKPIDDAMIPPSASLHASLKNERRREISQSNHPDIVQQKINARKMVPHKKNQDGHVADFSTLRHRDDRTGAPYAPTFFWKFVREAHQLRLEERFSLTPC